MDWALENWFWILIFVFFIATHLFGHGGHGGHGSHAGHKGHSGDVHKNTDENEKEDVRDHRANRHTGEHQH